MRQKLKNQLTDFSMFFNFSFPLDHLITGDGFAPYT